MIEKFYIDAWRDQAPWIQLRQVEQDLIISRALVELYRQEKIRNNYVFRGGTALNKLILKTAARYSEDIDLVQKNAEPIGETITVIRNVLDSWLGIPKRKLTERSAKLIYRYRSEEGVLAKLKIEINITEHYHLYEYVNIPFMMDSQWFQGRSSITTYDIDELMGSKLRALYQRRKGRDLFDIWLMLKNNMIDISRVISVFQEHCKRSNETIKRALFEKSLFEKSLHKDFREEMSILLNKNMSWDFEIAYREVLDKIITCIPGEPWSGDVSFR